MSYLEFLEEFADDLQEELYRRDREVEVSLIDVEKPWGKQSGLQVSDGRNVCPVIYPDKQYEYYKAGMNYPAIIALMADSVENAMDDMPEKYNFDFMALKDTISMQLINTERSMNYIKGKVHREIEDLSIIYRLNIELNSGQKGSIVVSEDMMKLMGMKEEDLYQLAMEKAPINYPYAIKSLKDMIGDMLPDGEDNDCPMMVVTNDESYYGASAIFYPYVLEQCAAVMNGDFYVLPSSVHECILCPDNNDITLKELKNIVKEVNDNELSPEDLLSYNIYHYDWKDKVFELADKFVERMKAKGKNSILNELFAKKEILQLETPLKRNQDIGTRRYER